MAQLEQRILINRKGLNVPVRVRIQELMTERFGSNRKKWPSATSLGRLMSVDYRTVQEWIDGDIKRADLEVLEEWCKLLNVQPGDILVRDE